MQTIRYKYLVWLLAALLLSTGCRRDLYYETEQPPVPPTPPQNEYASVLITFDWAQSGLTVEQINRASALIYPEAGGDPIEVILSKDITSTTVLLPLGAYRVVGLNETTSTNDWLGMDFSSREKFDTFTASIRPVSKSGEVLVGSGDHLSVASSDRFEVNQAMINQPTEQNRLIVSLVPKQVTQPIIVRVKIQNLDNARYISATLSGMYASMSLTSGKYSDLRATHTFSLVDRSYDQNNPHNGMVSTQFYVFKVLELDQPRKLLLKAELLDGSTYDAEFDVTSKIVLGQLIYEVEVGTTAEEPVILPPLASEYLPVTFNLNWDDSKMLPNDAKYASVWVYPSEGDGFELLLESDKRRVTTNLKVGSYSVVAFNERKGSNVWRGANIFDEIKYNTINVNMATPQTIIASDIPQIVGANVDLFEVKEGVENQLTLTLTPITKVLEVKAKINNLDNVRSVSCRLTGMSSGTLFATRADYDNQSTYSFNMSQRTYDVADKRNGTLTTTFYVFGKPTIPFERTLEYKFTLLDFTQENALLDVSNLIKTNPNNKYDYLLNVDGISVTERPRLPIEGDPNVDPWNPEENNPLQ